MRNDTLIVIILVTSSIARSAKRRYLSYPEAYFEVFRPAGATRTRCTHGGKVPSSVPNFTHIGATIWVLGPPKLKFLLRFDQNVEYKRPEEAYLLRDFHKVCRV